MCGDIVEEKEACSTAEDQNERERTEDLYIRMFKLALSRLKGKGSSHDAEDCVQEAMLELLKAKKDNIVIENEAAWLYRVVYNRANVYLRNLIKQQDTLIYFEEPEIDFDKDEKYGYTDKYNIFANTDHTDAEIQMMKERLLPELLETLTERDRVLFQEHFVNKKSAKELAELFGVTTNNINQRVYRVKCRISLELRCKIREMKKNGKDNW